MNTGTELSPIGKQQTSSGSKESLRALIPGVFPERRGKAECRHRSGPEHRQSDSGPKPPELQPTGPSCGLHSSHRNPSGSTATADRAERVGLQVRSPRSYLSHTGTRELNLTPLALRRWRCARRQTVSFFTRESNGAFREGSSVISIAGGME